MGADLDQFGINLGPKTSIEARTAKTTVDPGQSIKLASSLFKCLKNLCNRPFLNVVQNVSKMLKTFFKNGPQSGKPSGGDGGEGGEGEAIGNGRSLGVSWNP